MIICNNCRHQEIDGAIFCSECGAQLENTTGISTRAFQQASMNKPTTADFAREVPVAVSAWLTLHLVETGDLIPLSERTEFTLGRIAEGQPIMPDIDLTPYQAYENGISRLHLVIRKLANKIIAMDLGSANGSYLNGARMAPNIEETLRHGDVLALGKLRLQILINENI